MKRILLYLAAVAVLCACGSARKAVTTAPQGNDSPAYVQAFEQELCDIENEGTRKFLEEVDYSSDPDYVLSYAKDYRKDYGANDRPLPVKVSWTGTAARVVVSTSPQFDGSFEVQAEASRPRSTISFREYSIITRSWTPMERSSRLPA